MMQSKWRHLILVLAVLIGMAGMLQAATYSITYHVSTAGKVSLNVYDANGAVVRELLRASQQNAGDHTIYWDGLDRTGKGVPAGSYTWKMLVTPGLSSQFLLDVGSNYPIGTDLNSSSGLGNHCAPFTMAVDSNGIYMAASGAECVSGLVMLNTAGNARLWSQYTIPDTTYVSEGARSVAVVHNFTSGNDEEFILGRMGNGMSSPQQLYVVNAATGAAVRRFGVDWQIDDGYAQDPPDIGATGDPCLHGATDMDVCTDPVGHVTTLVVAYRAMNTLRWYDPNTGALLDSAAVTAPAGITVDTDGWVYVCTNGQVVRLKQSAHTPQVIVSTGFTSPGRLDVDHANHDLFVYDAGTQQVQQYRLNGGTYAPQNTYGRSGGRQDGLYNAPGQASDKCNFAGVSDLCADGAGTGGFYIAEPYSAPRRIAHVASPTTISQEWYGGQQWAPCAQFDPDDPTVMWVNSADLGGDPFYIIRATIDYNATPPVWAVHSTYKYLSQDTEAQRLIGGEYRGRFRVIKHGATKYLVSGGVLKIDETNWALIPVEGAGSDVGGTFFWTDGDNGGQANGQVEACEKTYYTGSCPAAFTSFVDNNFGIYWADVSSAPYTVRRYQASWVQVAGQDYAPKYVNYPTPDPTYAAPFPARFLYQTWAGMIVTANTGLNLFHDTATGQLYAVCDPWCNSVYMGGWCNSSDCFMQNWTASGQLRWGVGERGPSTFANGGMYTPTDPGLVYQNLRSIAGVAHGCILATDVDGGWYTELAQTYVWDQDGLFVGSVMDAVNPASPAFMYHCGGEFLSSTVYELANGDVYFAGNFENATRVYKVTGWSNWERQQSATPMSIATPTTDNTGQGLTAEYFDNKNHTGLVTTRVDNQVDFNWGAGIPSGTGITSPDTYSVRWRGSIRPTYGPKYTGPWERIVDGNAHDGASHTARDNSASVEFKFVGSSVSVRAITGPTSGYANIYVDGYDAGHIITPPVGAYFEFYSPTTQYDQNIYTWSGSNSVHTITVEAVGWYGGLRNASSTDYFISIDKFVVNGSTDIDDDGLEYTFYTNADDGAQLWINPIPGRSDTTACIISDWKVKSAASEKAGVPIKLWRRDNPIQLNYFNNTGTTSQIQLKWSSQLEGKDLVPTANLFPIVAQPAEASPVCDDRDLLYGVLNGSLIDGSEGWTRVPATDIYTYEAESAVSFDPSYGLLTHVRSNPTTGTQTAKRMLPDNPGGTAGWCISGLLRVDDVVCSSGLGSYVTVYDTSGATIATINVNAYYNGLNIVFGGTTFWSTAIDDPGNPDVRFANTGDLPFTLSYYQGALTFTYNGHTGMATAGGNPQQPGSLEFRVSSDQNYNRVDIYTKQLYFDWLQPDLFTGLSSGSLVDGTSGWTRVPDTDDTTGHLNNSVTYDPSTGLQVRVMVIYNPTAGTQTAKRVLTPNPGGVLGWRLSGTLRVDDGVCSSALGSAVKVYDTTGATIATINLNGYWTGTTIVFGSTTFWSTPPGAPDPRLNDTGDLPFSLTYAQGVLTFTYNGISGTATAGGIPMQPGSLEFNTTIDYNYNRMAIDTKSLAFDWLRTVANTESYTPNEDTPLTVTAPGVLANDVDYYSDTLTAAKATDPLHGTVTVNGNGSFTYTPTANYNGPDSFTYTASNLHSGAGTGTVNITVTAVNDVPSFTKGGNQLVNQNCGAQTVPGWATALSAGPADEASQTLNFIVSNNNNPLFSAQPAINAAGVLTFTPATNAWGSATVTVQIHDNGGMANGGVDTSASQTCTITVNALPAVSITAPAPDQVFTAPASIAITATASDSDGTVSKVEFFQGSTLLNTDSTSPYSYDWTGVAANSYALTAKAYDDLNEPTTSTTVNITVQDPCAAPTFNPAAGTYGSAQSVTISTTTGGATIRYTTDGTTPSSTVGTVYSAPVSITSTCTLKTIAYKSGMADSSVTSGVYTISASAPTYQAAGTLVNGTGTISPAWPTHQAGDVALLIVESANQAITLSVPAGFVAVTNSPQGTGTAGGTAATRLTVFWKRATTSAEATPTVADSGDHQVARIITFRGVTSTGNPWDVTAGNVASTASTAVSIPGATTTVANTLVVAIVANRTDTTTAQTSAWTNANLTSLTERIDSNANAGNGGGFGVAAGVKATAGAYGTTTATLATSSVQGRMTIALKP